MIGLVALLSAHSSVLLFTHCDALISPYCHLGLLSIGQRKPTKMECFIFAVTPLKMKPNYLCKITRKFNWIKNKAEGILLCSIIGLYLPHSNHSWVPASIFFLPSGFLRSGHESCTDSEADNISFPRVRSHIHFQLHISYLTEHARVLFTLPACRGGSTCPVPTGHRTAPTPLLLLPLHLSRFTWPG